MHLPGVSLRIAILSSEALPFSKTGGLADVAGALPKFLRMAGQEVSLTTPLYEETDRSLIGYRVLDDLEVEWRDGHTRISVYYSEASGAPVFLIDAPHYFARSGAYGYNDDHERFAFFCRASLALLRRVGAPPDIVHGNDWPCGFASVELRQRRAFDSFFSRTRTLFSIHNLAYQGTFGLPELHRMGFGSIEANGYFAMNGTASALKAGLMTSDMLSTVSRRYALEIQSAEHGHGLDWLLRARSDRLVGITNGVDYEVWNPQTDPHLSANYDAGNLSGKKACKLDLLRTFGLPEEPDRPLMASVSRLIKQKGFELIKELREEILSSGAFLISLGSGEKQYEDFLQWLRDRFPHRVAVHRGFSEALAHKIEAGADIFLMPSLYEPCGLNQMYSLRYGTVPVVRATGGLDDTVQDFDRITRKGNGFKFRDYSASALLEKIDEALYCYAEPDIWHLIQVNGMQADNSWSAAARRYIDLYQMAMKT